MPKKLNWVIAMSFAALSSANATESNPREVFSVGDKQAYITILSYNVQGLPAIAGIKQDRYKDIGLELAKLREKKSQPSIVLLQEAFVAKTDEIASSCGYKYIARGPQAIDKNENGSTVIKLLNGGIKILSDFPIAEEVKVAYGEFMCSTWDCFANKGAQAVRVEVPGIPFPLTIANTHTQAADKYDEVRIKQFDVLWRFINKFATAKQPLFAIGDFNSYPIRSCYQHWCKESKMTSVTEACLGKTLDCHVIERNHLGFDHNPDQQFYRSGQINGYNVEIHPVYAEHTFTEPVNGRVLSDHWGYSVTYEIKWEPAHALASSSK
jgi:endonuclease/exonuclease/phosphatase family metal-dependent hydrolase